MTVNNGMCDVIIDIFLGVRNNDIHCSINGIKVDNSITHQAMHDELGVIVTADLVRLQAIYGTSVEPLTALSLNDLPVTEQMDVVFDYVVNAKLPRNFPLSDALHDLTDYFLENISRSPMISLHASAPIQGVCAWLVETAVVRWGLDIEEISAFSIKQLATLANMDERSVRNAANPKHAQPLKTFRDSEGTTKVLREDAVAWLEGRRSFKKTVFLDAGVRNLETNGFVDTSDLGSFIEKLCIAQSKALKDVLQAAGLEKQHKQWLQKNAQVNYSLEVDKLRILACELDIDERSFIMAACKVLQKAELARIEAILSN